MTAGGGEPNGPSTLVGLESITDHVATRLGFRLSTDTIRRLSKRANDPAPLREWGANHPRIIVDVAALAVDQCVDTRPHVFASSGG